MPGINLLPDELRSRDNKEMEAVKKQSKEMKIELAMPLKEKAVKPAKVSIWQRLFKRKPKAPKPEKAPAPQVPVVPVKKEPQNLPPLPPVKPPVIPAAPAPRPPLPAPAKPYVPPAPVVPPRPVTPIAPVVPAKPPEIKPAAPPAMPEPYKSQVLAGIKNHDDKNLKLKERSKRKFSFGLFRGRKKQAEPAKKAAAAKEGKKEPKKEKTSILGINLIPQELTKHPELELSKKLVLSSVFTVIAVLIAVGAYFGLTWYQIKVTRDINEVRGQIVVLDKEIESKRQQSAAAFALQDNLQTIKELLNSHIYWTKFFGLMEKYTLADVYFANFSISGRDKLSIAAVGRDYSTVAKQLIAYRQAPDFVKSVKIDAAAASYDEQKQLVGVTFNINLELTPDVFFRPIQ